MVTEALIKRKIRTVNVNIDLYKKLYLLKIEKNSESLSSLIEEIYEERQGGKK